MKGNWAIPTSVKFGAGRIGELAKTCKQAGMKAPLLVTDPGLAAMPMVSEIMAANKAEELPTGLFSNLKANPSETNLLQGLAVYKENGHDGVIALGGGSAMDLGKAIALMVNTDEPWQTMEDKQGGWRKVKAGQIAPWIAVPTTAGTGSEASAGTVIVDEQTGNKKVLFHPALMATGVIADPELTLGLPAHLTAYTGLDALTHCIEALSSPLFHPMAEGIALEGMRLIAENLLQAYKDGANLEARANMLAAATMGGTSFMKGLGLVHALSHAAGALLDTQHGLTNAVFLPYALTYNREAIEDKMIRAARTLDLEDQSFEGFVAWVVDFRKRLGIPHTSESLGVNEDNIDKLAELATADSAMLTNPKKTEAAQMAALYRKSLNGEV